MGPLALQPRQQQKQSLSPAMWLGLNLLTLPIGELREAVKKELESNPALEVDVPRLSSRVARPAGEPEFSLENVADDSGESLGDHLLSELRMSGVSGRELELCQAIVSDLDRDGRFVGALPDLQMVTGASAEALEAARQKVMSTDPQGCGARTLEECWLAQLDQVPSAKRELVRKSIAAVAAMLEKRQVSSTIDPEAIKLLRKLDPYPGRQYDFRRTEFVVPDIRVDEDGEVLVDQRDIPALRISPKYAQMAQDRELDAETRRFAAERVRKAREFREAVIKRQETMETVAELAIGGQSRFLAEGASGIVRQTMSEIAKKAKCNVATVSRAAARKFVKTPRGTVPLRKFFALVDQAPVEKLREILAAAKGALSDRVIAEEMAKAGFPMARRTVAKYRVKLGA